MDQGNEKQRSVRHLGPNLTNALPFSSGSNVASEGRAVFENHLPRSNRKHPFLIEQEQNVLNWPTETFSIDYYDKQNQREYPHTVLLFVPGNPGCMGWYTDLIFSLVDRLGLGFAARGLSYAGHGINSKIANVERWEHNEIPSDSSGENYRDVRIPWSVDGQIKHKIAWMDQVEVEMELLRRKRLASKTKSTSSTSPRYIFISHSIGAHMVQRLSILRPDILEKTILQIHLMPYIRTDAPQPQQGQLSVAANAQSVVISIAKKMARIKSCLPLAASDFIMKGAVPDEKGRKLAVGIARQPHFARNFFELGLEEIRDVPELPDDSALRLIGKICPIEMLYVGGPDHWAPPFHMDDLQQLRDRGSIPKSVNWTYMPELLHGFVVFPEMVPVVADFCFQAICKVKGTTYLTSRL